MGRTWDFVPVSMTGKGSDDQTIGIAEDSFWLLEPAIKKCCDRYRGYVHWWVTTIPREEWLMILDEWNSLRDGLVAASLTTDIPTLRRIPRYARKESVHDFHRNCMKLMKMIGQLDVSVRTELCSHEHISILGI